MAQSHAPFYPGIVEGAADSAEDLDRLGDHHLNLLGDRDVCREAVGSTARLFDHRDSLHRAVRHVVGDHAKTNILGRAQSRPG
jgi:hypothetical protein